MKKKRRAEYKPLLFTTTMRNPERVKGFLKILSYYNGAILTDDLAKTIMGEVIRYGLYRPIKLTSTVKYKWKNTHRGNFATEILSDQEVKDIIKINPQNHKEAGFIKGWPSRFATNFDFAKELGFVYFWINEPIVFSQVGLKLANSIDLEVDENGFIKFSDVHPNFEQQAFLHALAKYQRSNPFVRVLNDNVPFILLLQVITKLNSDPDYNNCGISRLELPLIIFWKNNDSEKLYRRIKKLRRDYGYNPSKEVIIDICINEIMEGKFKKFKPKSIISDYPDEFIRKMRITGLISLRGRGRFVDINKKEQDKVDYILKTYSSYRKYKTEIEYFNYMATIDDVLFSFESISTTPDEKNKYLEKWVDIYPWDEIKKEMLVLSKKGLSRDNLLKLIPEPVRLEFLTAIAIKSRYKNVRVYPNYACDDEGLPTSTAAGVGNQGDIECYEGLNGILIEVTMLEGRTQTVMEVWPITRHLISFNDKVVGNAICYFIAPSIYIDSVRQISFVKKTEDLFIKPHTISDFLEYIENSNIFYKKGTYIAAETDDESLYKN